MLALTRRTEYALMALCHLAHRQGQWISARDIADDQGAQLPLLMNVMKTLSQAGFVSSARGSRGGYRLQVLPAAISLSAVIRAVEGPVRLVRCADRHLRGDTDPRCEMESNCRIKGAVGRVHERFRQFLESVTVADLALELHTISENETFHDIGSSTHAIHLSRQ